MLVERREALTRRPVQTVARLQALLAELLAGQSQEGHHHRSGQTDACPGPSRRPGRKTRRRITAEELVDGLTGGSATEGARPCPDGCVDEVGRPELATVSPV